MNWPIQLVYEELIRQRDRLNEVLADIENTINMLEHTNIRYPDIAGKTESEILKTADKISYLVQTFSDKIDRELEKLIDLLEKARMR